MKNKTTAFLPLSQKVRDEIEETYPKVIQIKEIILEAMTVSCYQEDEEVAAVERKTRINKALTKAKLFMLSQQDIMTRKPKPKKATKLCMYTKRTITMLRLALDSLSDSDQLEAYHKLALICTYFVNILLGSSLTEACLPKFLACHLYCFLKNVFSMDLEFVLDVLICSNIFDENEHGESQKKALSYNILEGAMLDHHLYSSNIQTFSKYLVIVAFWKHTNSRKEPFPQIRLELNCYYKDFQPVKVLEYIQEKYKTRRANTEKTGLTWQVVLQRIIPKLGSIPKVIRRRLIKQKKDPVVSSIDSVDSSEPIMEATHDKGSSEPEDQSSSSAPLFFMDTVGSTENAVSSSNTGGRLKFFSEAFSSNEDASFEGLSLLPHWFNESETKNEPMQQVPSDPDSPTSTVLHAMSPSSSPPHINEVDNHDDQEENEDADDEEEDQDNADQNQNEDDTSEDEAPIRNTSMRKAKRLEEEKEDSDSDDLEVVFEDTSHPISQPNASIIRKLMSGDDEQIRDDDEGSRDYASSESGESVLPDLNGAYEDDADEAEEENAKMVDNNDVTMNGHDNEDVEPRKKDRQSQSPTVNENEKAGRKSKSVSPRKSLPNLDSSSRRSRSESPIKSPPVAKRTRASESLSLTDMNEKGLRNTGRSQAKEPSVSCPKSSPKKSSPSKLTPVVEEDQSHDKAQHRRSLRVRQPKAKAPTPPAPKRTTRGKRVSAAPVKSLAINKAAKNSEEEEDEVSNEIQPPAKKARSVSSKSASSEAKTVEQSTEISSTKQGRGGRRVSQKKNDDDTTKKANEETSGINPPSRAGRTRKTSTEPQPILRTTRSTRARAAKKT